MGVYYRSYQIHYKTTVNISYVLWIHKNNCYRGLSAIVWKLIWNKVILGCFDIIKATPNGYNISIDNIIHPYRKSGGWNDVMDIILFLLNGFMIVKRLEEAIYGWCVYFMLFSGDRFRCYMNSFCNSNLLLSL